MFEMPKTYVPPFRHAALFAEAELTRDVQFKQWNIGIVSVLRIEKQPCLRYGHIPGWRGESLSWNMEEGRSSSIGLVYPSLAPSAAMPFLHSSFENPLLSLIFI